MSLLDIALKLAGMPQATIDELDRSMPGLARLAVVARNAEPLLTQAKPHLDALLPIAAKLWPQLQAAWPDIVAVTPTIEQLIEFAKSRE
jgi:hypothetical protein